MVIQIKVSKDSVNQAVCTCTKNKEGVLFHLPCRDPLDLLISQYKAALAKGGAFIQRPVPVSKDGVRIYGHPLTCDWAIAMDEIIREDPTVVGRAAAERCEDIFLLAFSMFSDKTSLGNNLSAYPVQVCQMHSSAKDIHATFSTGAGVTAYIPSGHKPADYLPQKHTEEMSALLASCLNEVRACAQQRQTSSTDIQNKLVGKGAKRPKQAADTTQRVQSTSQTREPSI